IETQRGILINDRLETSVPNIYAIGDCAQARDPLPGRRPIEAIWYTGRMMGEAVAYNVCGKERSYDPGIWFNSAKFFDIEYQVYGTVYAHTPPEQASIYWEHPDGKKSIRICYSSKDNTIQGFHLMGVRYRHEVCEKWIAQNTSVEEVLTNLGLANFDPEFYKEYEQDVVSIYNQQSGKNLQLKQKRGLTAALKFLRKKVTA
ncbi:MAG: FAD-dependent oxidoreductase, partial [Bacteroidota bacterium]